MLKEKVIEAYAFAKRKHAGQHKKFSKLPYFVHPKAVARIVEDLTKDQDIIIAALLHDTIEDTNTKYSEIRKLFGKKVADLVAELTNNEIECKKLGKAKYLTEKMALMSSDALVIKLADRLNNVLFLERDQVPLEFITKYEKETRYIVTVMPRERLVVGGTLNQLHTALIDMIIAVLKFLQVRYKL